jgi:hypothetical protein
VPRSASDGAYATASEDVGRSTLHARAPCRRAR